MNNNLVFENIFNIKIIVRNWGVQKITHQGIIVRSGLSLIIYKAVFIHVKGFNESKIGLESLSFK